MDGITTFLREAVIGRTLHTDPLTYTLEGGLLEGEYADRMAFSNLALGPASASLSFDLFVVAEERIYRMDGMGNRTGLDTEFSSASLFRYRLARRRSTGAITGTMRFISSTLPDAPAEAMASLVDGFRLENGVLRWRERELLYRDQPDGAGGFRPVAFEATCSLHRENGTSRYEYDGTCFDVDPGTWARTPSTAVYPRFIARERQGDKP